MIICRHLANSEKQKKSCVFKEKVTQGDEIFKNRKIIDEKGIQIKNKAIKSMFSIYYFL